MVRFASSLRPWRLAAVLLAATALFIGQVDRAQALIVTSVTLNAPNQGDTSNLSIDLQLDTALSPGDSIVITFPADSTPAATGTPWQVPNSGDLSGSVSWSGIIDPAPAITSNAGARTITTTVAMPQLAGTPLTITIGAGAGLTNPATAGTYRITVDATGNAQAQSGDVTILAPAPPALGAGNVVLTNNLTSANTAGTIAFTLVNALAQNDTITLSMPIGWLVQNGAYTAGNWTGINVGGVAGNSVLSTVTITIGAGGEAAGPKTLTIAGSTQLRNAVVANAAYTIDIAATGHTAATTNAFSVAGAVSAANSTVDSAPGSVAANGVTASTITVTLKDGTGAGIPVSGQTVTLAQGAGASVISAASGLSTAAGVVTFTVTNTTAQNVTYTATSGVAITDTASVNFTAVAAGALTATNVQPASLVAGVTGNATVSFTTTSAVQNNGKIKVTFPAGFDVSGATFGSVGGALDGTAIVSVAGQVVTITRTGGTALGASAAGTVTLGGIKNPNAAGNTGAYTITTTNAADVTIDTDAAVAADTIVAGAANKLQLLVPGETTSPGSVSGKTGTPSGQTTGTAFTVTVRMVDANWNLVTSTDTIAITTSGTGTMPANAALVGGTQTFSVTITVAGSPTLTATDVTDGTKTASTSPAITVSTPPPPPPENDPDPGPGNNPPGFNPFVPQPLTCDDGFMLVNGVCVAIPPAITLSSLTVSTGVLSPAFSSGITAYTVEVPASQQTLTVTGVASNTTSPVLIGTRAGVGSLTFTETLPEGTSSIPVVVTSADNFQRTTYTITVNRAAVPTLPLRFVSSTSRTVTVSVTTSVDEQVRVIPRAPGAPAPSWVNAYTGLGSLVGSPPMHDVVAGQAKEFEVLGLTPGTTYDFYAASASGLLSAKVTATTQPLQQCSATEFFNGSNCQALSVCSSGEFEFRPPTSTSDRTCQSVRVCTDSQYEVSAPTSTTNRICRTFTVCPAGQVQTVAPTATSDRVCAPAITNASIRLSSTTAAATDVTYEVIFTTPVAIPSGGQVRVAMPGVALPASPVATFTMPSALGNAASFANGTLTVTLPGGSPASEVRLQLSRVTNPAAAQAERSNLRFEVTNSAGTVLASTSTGTMPAIEVPGITNVSFRPSSTAARAQVELEITFTPATALAGGSDNILFNLGDWIIPTSSGVPASVTQPGSGPFDTTGAISGGLLSLTIPAGSSVQANQAVTVRLKGFTNPPAGTIRKEDLTVQTTKDTTPVAAGADVVIAVPSLTGVLFTAEPSTPNTATTIVVKFTPSTPMADGSTIRLVWTDFTSTTGVTAAATFEGASGTTARLSGLTGTGATVTVAGNALPGGSPVTLRITGYTTPAEKTIAKSGLTVATSQVTTAVASSADITIAPALSVSIAGPTTAVAGPARGSVQLTTTVSGQGGATPTYAWTVTGAGCSDLVGPLSLSSLSVFVATTATTCNFTLTVTTGSATATASHTIAFTAEAKRRLEFASQPTGSTAGRVDLSLGVRVLNADGTVNTGFTGNVTLSARASGRTFTVGISRVSEGVAQFDRAWTPQLADATWVLVARATGYDEVTTNEFRVTKLKSLKFTTQPVGGAAGAALAAQPKVTAYNADGTEDTSFTGSVSLVLKADTANGATLTATSTAAVGGVASFTGVSINNAGTGYVLVASATGYADIASAKFDVTAAATKIVITQYTATGVAGRPSAAEVRAEARDAGGRLVPSAASGLSLGVRYLESNSLFGGLIAPTRVVDGVAIYLLSSPFPLRGEYRWEVTSATLRAETEAFTVTSAPAKLVFVQQPGGFGSTLGTQPVVEIQDSAGNRVVGATDEVTLAVVTSLADWGIRGTASVAASAGRATFTNVGVASVLSRGGAGETFRLAATATGLTSAQSDSFSPPGPVTKLIIAPGVPSTLEAGQKFNLAVMVADAANQTNPGSTATVTLAMKTGVGTLRGTNQVAAVDGVATFTGLYLNQAGTFTIEATSGVLTAATTSRITVTAATQPAALVFSKQPTYEVTGVAFSTQPVLTLIDATGATFTGAGGTVTLSIGFSRITVQVPPTLDDTLTQNVSSGVATFTGLKARTATEAKGVVLTATWMGPTGMLTATSAPFDVYTSATAAATAAAKQEPVSAKLRFEYDSSLLDNSAARSSLSTSLKSDTCTALNLTADACARVSVTIASSQSVTIVESASGRVMAVANIDVVDGEPRVLLASVNRMTFEAETRATAPAGTSLLYTVGRAAFDAFDNELDVLPSARSFSLPVPESVVLLGTRPGDLRVVWWDGARWTLVPSRTIVGPGGTFTVTATTDALGVFGVLYAPGASRIEGLARYSEDGAGFGVFTGGGVATLAHAAGLNEASGAWVQDATGAYRLLVVGGPAFLATEFAARFPDGIASSTAVTLVQTRPALDVAPLVSAVASVASSAPAPVAAVAPAVRTGTPLTSATYTVAAADTLSEIALRFGLEQAAIAEANGIAGPNYIVRTGQALTIPSGGKTLVSHTVSGTDTLSSIGTLYGVGWPEIAALNHIAGPNYTVRPGQVLTIAR